jgi:HD-GYP domain-containing protein (c-di-GMP phosphodiesterase class II)
MSDQQRYSSLKSYFPQALAATLLVLGLPLVVVIWLEASGLVTSTVSSIIVGVVLSFGTGSLGSALWMRFSRSSDLVFGDLMLWGWLRRYLLEKRIMRSATLLAGVGDGSSGATLSLGRQSRILHKLASSLESADTYTHGHSRRVARHAYMIAKRMGLDGGESALIRTAAAIHDVGKLRVPVAVLHKPDRFTDEEFAEIKKHPVAGAEMVSTLGNERLTAIVRHHHERLDGAGYPDRLAGNQIPLRARIIAVADTFDAITSARPYRAASRHKKAIEIIRKEAGTQLDPHAVEAFLHYYAGRRSITLLALLTSAPHRALEATSGLLRKTVFAGITNAASASTAA